MKKYIILLILFTINNIQSQNIIVLDSVTHNPISFVNIQFNKNTGTYTNEKGLFEINKNSKDTLIFSHISYNSYKIIASEIKDIIILSPNIILLKEVEISNKKHIIKNIDFPKKCNSFSNWPVSSKSEIITLVIPNIENSNSIIKKLDFGFVRKKEENTNLVNQTALRVNIYAKNNNEIKEKIYSSDVIIINPNKKEKIELNLENESIEFAQKGLFIGLEVIGDIDNLGNIIKEKSFIHPLLTDRTIDDYSSKTYIKYIFDTKLNLKPINDILKETSGQTMEINLSFGMTISK